MAAEVEIAKKVEKFEAAGVELVQGCRSGRRLDLRAVLKALGAGSGRFRSCCWSAAPGTESGNLQEELVDKVALFHRRRAGRRGSTFRRPHRVGSPLLLEQSNAANDADDVWVVDTRVSGVLRVTTGWGWDRLRGMFYRVD